MLLRALQYAKTFGYTVWLRPQDPYIGRGGVAHSGPLASRLGLSGVPVMSETIALHTIFELMRATGARVHLCRISSAAALELIRAAKKEGLPVTCDVGVHHLHMTDADIGFFDPNARLTPPLRSQRDREAIRAGAAGRHHRRRLLRPHPGRRRREAAAVRRSLARRHRPGTAAVADAEVGRGAAAASADALSRALAKITARCRRAWPACRPARCRWARAPTWCCSIRTRAGR